MAGSLHGTKKDKDIIVGRGERGIKELHTESDTGWSLKAESSKGGKISEGEGVTANNSK